MRITTTVNLNAVRDGARDPREHLYRYATACERAIRREYPDAEVEVRAVEASGYLAGTQVQFDEDEEYSAVTERTVQDVVEEIKGRIWQRYQERGLSALR